MKFNFEDKVDRNGLATIRELSTPAEVKNAGLISLWGAEFEFPIPDFILEGIKSWLDKGTISYSAVDETYLSLIKNWMKMHRNWLIETDWIVPTYGHTHSVGTICRAFTQPGDGVIGLSPTYHNTFKPVILNDRIHVDCPLLFDGSTYTVDFKRLETLMAVPENKVLCFCNPHNPIGKVWGREVLEKIASLAYQYDMIVYSDEIFGDMVYENIQMLTFDQVSSLPVKWIVGTSLGKTYSITGIPQANMIIRNRELREQFLKQRDRDHYGSLNPMIRAAYLAGYTSEGSAWIQEMMKYCRKNAEWIRDYCQKHLPQMKVIEPEGTYILWIDCRGLMLGTDEAYEAFFTKAYCICDSGSVYGSPDGFIRLNVAAPLPEIAKVFEQLKMAVDGGEHDKKRSI